LYEWNCTNKIKENQNQKYKNRLILQVNANHLIKQYNKTNINIDMLDIK